MLGSIWVPGWVRRTVQEFISKYGTFDVAGSPSLGFCFLSWRNKSPWTYGAPHCCLTLQPILSEKFATADREGFPNPGCQHVGGHHINFTLSSRKVSQPLRSGMRSFGSLFGGLRSNDDG